jgi:hypothetical protein
VASMDLMIPIQADNMVNEEILLFYPSLILFIVKITLLYNGECFVEKVSLHFQHEDCSMSNGVFFTTHS